MTQLIEEILAIFDLPNARVDLDDIHLELEPTGRGLEITIGQMYESPVEINFKTLSKLGELFGTEEIDVDNFANSGCESCDYGSDYGHTIQIYNPTLRLSEITKLTLEDLE
jgi:hypothetical protein